MARLGRPFEDPTPPSAAPVWAAIEGLARYHVLVAALELDVFDGLVRTGPAGVEALAAELGVSAPHLGSLLDGVVALGLLDQVDDVYELNDTARRYLVGDGPASMAGLVAVAPGPAANWPGLADTVRTGRPARPIEEDAAAFYVPLVEGTFATMLRCATRADRKVRYSATPAVRVLDLGAGGAPWSIAVLRACRGGTAVVNDLPGVLDVAARRLAEHAVADRAELRPGDFHAVAVEPGAHDLVVLGHVCRTEGVDGARHLIERAHTALAPGGRLLLADYFVDPARTANPHAVLMGTTMMASTERGMTFTTGRFAGWLREAGFVDLRLVEPIGFQQVIVATRGEE